MGGPVFPVPVWAPALLQPCQVLRSNAMAPQHGPSHWEAEGRRCDRSPDNPRPLASVSSPPLLQACLWRGFE